ncbi:hypothetical protein [Synechococcus sp. ROS8604]|uniref:hypothetical protein n=1 Tax=Synechococcus sp. ROS8604 TaxID=1442557 RepID=UPI00210757CE|nr:hypothetical protein [Synechococcus sp. ROS8604]
MRLTSISISAFASTEEIPVKAMEQWSPKKQPKIHLKETLAKALGHTKKFRDAKSINSSKRSRARQEALNTENYDSTA